MGADFGQHIELIRRFLTQREAIVERIGTVLSMQRRHLENPSLLTAQFEACFAAENHSSKQLEAAYCAAGFRPREVNHLYNDLIHPVEMLIRGVHCWQQTWWPGRGIRTHYAHTLLNVYVLRCLQFLSLQIGDKEITELQSVLDELWKTSPPKQPRFVRDAHWLIPLAQSLITDQLEPYFKVAQQVAETLPEADSLEVQKAHVRMLGGHLASQVRYYSTQAGVPINDPSVVLRTRTSNALDSALLVQALVELLNAYDRAVQSGDERTRHDMAGAILQGISSDPELYLNRLDLLGPYTRIEHMCASPLGQRHDQLFQQYAERIAHCIPFLRDDLPHFKPSEDCYSPYGVIFGLPSSLIEHMALKAIEPDAETRFSLEDVFNDEPSAAKLAWVNNWRNLPHIPADVQELYAYPQPFAEAIYNRMASELSRREHATTGRLYIESEDAAIPELPASYLVSYDQAQLLRERQEGVFLVSYETPGGWTAIKKELLTEFLGTGHDARIVGLPLHAAQVLQLMCAGLVRP